MKSEQSALLAATRLLMTLHLIVAGYTLSPSVASELDAYYDGDIEPHELETFDLQSAPVAGPVGESSAVPPPPVLDPVLAPPRTDLDGSLGDAASDLEPTKITSTDHSCTEPNCGCANVCGCCETDCGCDCNYCHECECDHEPWRLQDYLMPSDSSNGIQIGGWIQAGIRTNDRGNSTSVGNSPGGGFTSDADEFNLHQMWGYVGKDADTGGCGTDWGFRFDFAYGVDGPDIQAFGDIGWDTEWDSGGQYGSAIPQLYVQGGWNDWNIIVGHFFTIIGYEAIQAPANFFFTHSYQQYYAEPFTHTGALVGYDINSNWTINGGYTLGWDSGFNNSNDAHTFLGGVAWTSDDENTWFAYAVNAGDFGAGSVVNAGDIYMHSVVVSRNLGSGWTGAVQHDYGLNTNVPAAPPLSTTEWYGVGAYLFKEINCCWSAGARLEWFRDDDGVRVNPLGVPPALAAGNYYEATVGLNWSPHDNFRMRPEVRYDWFQG
ncbi:MAG TPA: porin, partial [Pirellulales bacterium]|nr:porin [Pirellulales bacterium]